MMMPIDSTTDMTGGISVGVEVMSMVDECDTEGVEFEQHTEYFSSK